MDPVAALPLVVDFKVGNLQRTYSLDGCREGVVSRFRFPQPLARRSEGAENLCPVESLTLAMFAKLHSRIIPSTDRLMPVRRSAEVVGER